MDPYEVGTDFLFYAPDGHNYRLIVLHYNPHRELGTEYIVAVYDEENQYTGEVRYVGRNFLSGCLQMPSIIPGEV